MKAPVGDLLGGDGRAAAQGGLWWTPLAWCEGRWQSNVLLRANAAGWWESVQSGVQAPEQATRLAGAVLPALVNAHSHAFQRAFAGMAERRVQASDDFWSWRERMYGVALRITPTQLRAVAAQLFVELLQGGYSQVCEFHYLHHRVDGSAHDDPLAMALALVDAAADAGIGLTLLPTLYGRAGFAQDTLRAEQRRFASTPAWVAQASAELRALRRPLLDTGVAVHSLRAARPQSIADLLARCGDTPVHIHVAEQVAEVADCVAATGQRPLQWLAAQGWLDARWQLVHATHSTAAEIEAVARSGAGVVLCPSTEANLGDGLCDLRGWLGAGVALSLGSDSQVCRRWSEELRLLEIGQRLVLRQRNVAADPQRFGGSTAERLFDAVHKGGAAACGRTVTGIAPDARADFLVLDPAHSGLLGVPQAHWLDALVFAADAPHFSAVYVAAQRVIEAGRHPQGDAIAGRFAQAMDELWAPA